MTTTQLLEILNEKKDIPLQQLLNQLPNLTFVDLINSYLENKHVTKSQLIQKTNLDRTYAYQIMNGTKLPSQDKVIQLALALELDLHNTNILLTLSDNKSLYPKLKRDALIIFCINNNYSVIKTNELLYEYHFSILE